MISFEVLFDCSQCGRNMTFGLMAVLLGGEGFYANVITLFKYLNLVIGKIVFNLIRQKTNHPDLMRCEKNKIHR